jgi:hypothetical protein
MKHLLALGFLVGGMFLSGCESFSDARDKFAAREQPRTHAYAADPRATYEAARKAADQMGYRFVRGGPAQGELEAISGLSTNDTMRSTHQISLHVKLNAALEGGTELSLLLRELIEADSVRRAGQATVTALRDTPQYEVFFRTVQQILDASKKP